LTNPQLIIIPHKKKSKKNQEEPNNQIPKDKNEKKIINFEKGYVEKKAQINTGYLD